MRHGRGFGAKRWLLFVACGWAPLVACGGRAASTGPAGGAPGAEPSRSGAGGTPASSAGSAGLTDSAGAVGEPPAAVDPEVSKAWTWRPCGTLEPEAADRAALFDVSGKIVGLGPDGVRVHEASGARATASSPVQADFLLTASDGAVLTGRRTGEGVALAPVGESAPSIVLPNPPLNACGPRFTMSTDGAYVLATGEGLGCAWRVSDSAFVGTVAGEQVTIRDSHFVTVERGPSTDVVQRDFAGRELSRRPLGDGPILLSPAGDRAVTLLDSALVDLDSGKVLKWDVPPKMAFASPVFSPRGEVVLAGDGVFSTADAVRRFSLDPAGRLAENGGRELELAHDGSRAVAYGSGRATLFDIEAKGVSAVLGSAVLADARRSGEGASDLAISRDGSLLVYNIVGSAAFGIRLAPSFSDSQVVWDMRVELNLSVDVTADGRLAAVGGDGRAIHDARDGHAVWPALPPPPDVVTSDICLLDRLRFSPNATFIAGSNYSRRLQVFAVNSAQPWQPLLELPGSCDAAVFSRDERLMATSAGALYRTGVSPSDWTQLWSTPLPNKSADSSFSDSKISFSPDEKQLLVSFCPTWPRHCVTTVLDATTGAVSRKLTELSGPHPAFSPEGSWVVAGNQLLHLASGEVRSLGADASETNPALFTPNGDIIAGSATGGLTRYCRDQ